MTLLEDLEAAAREIDCPVSDLCPAEDPCMRRPLAAGLRAHAKRLWEAMARADNATGPCAPALQLISRTINGGPLK